MFKNIFPAIMIIIFSLSCVPQTIKTEKIESVVKKEDPFAAYVIRDNINIRKTGSTSGEITGTAMDGDEVRILQNLNGWYEIQKNDNSRGWIRSDFIGPKSLSYTIKASKFVENTLSNYNVEIFIDENKPYEIIYMVLPDGYYNNKISAEKLVRKIGLVYQQDVYSGAVEIRILMNDRRNLFSKVNLKKMGITNLKAPLLKYGRTFAFDLIDYNKLKIQVLVQDKLSEKTFLQMSREISANYDIEIRKIEIFYVEDTAEGIMYFSQKDFIPSNKNICLFYYMEDGDGPDWRTNFCQ